MIDKETILDLGIGAGGEYLKDDSPAILRVGLDKEIWGAIVHTRKKLPNLVLIKADARWLPFGNSTFDQIEIYFPFLTILEPGLQNTLTDNPCWYQEFARILKPRGKLTIWGDHLISPGKIAQNSQRFFEQPQIFSLSLEELEAIGTSNSLELRKMLIEEDPVVRTIKLELLKGWTVQDSNL